MGVHTELNGDNGGNTLVEWGSIDVEVSDLTSLREADPKVLRISGGKRVDGVSSLKRHGSSGTMLASGVALSDADVTSLGFASNSNLFDCSVIFKSHDKITEQVRLVIGGHQSSVEISSRSGLLSLRSDLSLRVSKEGLN